MRQPKNRREAREWVRRHWANFIYHSDAQFDEASNPAIAEIWGDECRKIARRLAPGALYTPARAGHE